MPLLSSMGRVALETLRASLITGAALSLYAVEPELVEALHTTRAPLVDGVVVRPAPKVLRAPTEDARLAPSLPGPAPLAPGALRATAMQFHSRVYTRAAADASTSGLVMRDVELAAHARVTGTGCEGGSWYSVARGYVCTADGFRVTTQTSDRRRKTGPELAAALPYRYALVTTKAAPRFYTLPSVEDLRMVEAGGSPSSLELRMVGDYFIAIDRVVEAEAGSFYRTVRGKYVRVEDASPITPPTFVGEALSDRTTLPIAFAIEERTPLYRLVGDSLEPIGHAEKHARLTGVRVIEHEGESYVADEAGLALPRAAVRVAAEVERPRGAEESAALIHVDLSEQTLVAYDAHGPVYATLVSSGKEGYATPRGLFRVGMKYVSATMSGADPVDGAYEVEEVPWTLYFHGSYALHGAYWHGQFGAVRSHGCVNIAPGDARRIYAMVGPTMPAGWHTKVGKGTQVYITR